MTDTSTHQSNNDLQKRIDAFEIAAAKASPSIWITRGKAVFSESSNTTTNTHSSLQNCLFAVKDNIDVMGYPTTAACPEFSHYPSSSAKVVQRLIDSGACVVGKTNLDQFACGLVGTRTPYGVVQNAFDNRYISGGSSSGSAVAVALGLVDFALGTDTAGSGRIPAAFNNIVGLKPSRGLLSTHGVLPACAHIDCPSIFARTVNDAVKVLQVAAGYDSHSPYSRSVSLDTRIFPDAFTFAIPSDAHLEFFGDSLAEAGFVQACVRLRELGGTPVEIDYRPFALAATALYEDAWVAERYAAIEKIFNAKPDAFDPVVRGIIEKGRHYNAAQLFHAMERMALWRQHVSHLWQTIDVLMVPTAPTIYTIAQIQAEPVVCNQRLGRYTNAVNLLDLAAIAVPSCLRADGLPFGITFIGPAGSDLRLAQIAARYHTSTGLTLGVSDQPVPRIALNYSAAIHKVRVAVVGAHLTGLPLNAQLTERGAHLVRITKTAASYRFYALANTLPPKPGLLRVGAGEGFSIETEIWEMPSTEFGSFVALIPSPLGMGTIELEDGSHVQGFLCESYALHDARDITEYGGWRAYLKSITPLGPSSS